MSGFDSRDSFGHALLELRSRGAAFQRLSKGPWALFIAIAVHWQSNAEAWQSQEALARFSGWSSRAVRDQADTLERGGFLRIRRERRHDGSERIFYAPGVVTLAELTAFVDRFPREQAKPLRREPEQAPPAPPAPLPEPASGAPPEGVSMEHRDQDQIEPSSSCDAARESTSPQLLAEEQQPFEVSQEDREIARTALLERMARKHPTRPSPRWFDAAEIALVAACASALEGDREAKVQILRDAVAGAFVTSKDGAPTVRFIWGKLDHFLDHADRGRRRRLAEERNARQRAADRMIPSPQVARLSPPAVPHAQMAADLERLFGPGWGTNGPR